VWNVVFTQAARQELIDAQDWYESKSPGLGVDLRREVDTVVQRIGAHPLQFPIVHKTVRRALVRRFPYMLFFTVEGDTALVIACFHASRNPRHWQRRT
jgi:plasmid stabilization system protein ParE